MAICPFAVQQLIPESRTQNRIRPTTLILHRAVSNAETLQGYWNSPGVELESHFYVGPTGTLYQYVDTEVRADANVLANGFAISVETWDGGNTPDSDGWNEAQLATLKRLALWVCDTHGIAKRAATSWNGGGIGGHNWFPDEWAGGPRGCPGTARNAQIRNNIIPAVAAGRLEEDLDVDETTFRTWARRGNADWLKNDLAPGSDQREKLQDILLDSEVEVTPDPVNGVPQKPWKDRLRGIIPALDRRLVRVEDRVGQLASSGVPVDVRLSDEDVDRIATRFADVMDRRARDGDPSTGPQS